MKQSHLQIERMPCHWIQQLFYCAPLTHWNCQKESAVVFSLKNFNYLSTCSRFLLVWQEFWHRFIFLSWEKEPAMQAAYIKLFTSLTFNYARKFKQSYGLFKPGFKQNSFKTPIYTTWPSVKEAHNCQQLPTSLNDIYH